MADYENLGFQVNVDSDDAVSRLDTILKKLEAIQKIANTVSGGIGGKKGNGSSRNNASKKGFEHFSQTGKLNQRDTRQAKAQGNRAVYQDLKQQVAKETELNHAWKQQVETLTIVNNLKQKKISNDIISNNADVTAQSAQAKISELTAKTAVNNQLLASSEGKLAIEKKAVVEYDKSRIAQMARLKAEQSSLNSGKYEEARRIELANQQRKKEIDQRVKQQLGIKETTQSLGKYISKLTSVVMIARMASRFFSGAIKESAAYTENLVLFNVAFGESAEKQIDFALGIADAYGLARNEVVKFAGTFRELSSSLGLGDATADLASEVSTKLGYDLSALFNTSVEDAMEKLQSGVFSGNVRPLRAFGIDISQGQIDELFETNEALKQLGVNARNLSQSEKVVARLIITLKSSKDSFGTMAREVNNLQSQFRIFQGSIANFKLAVGEFVEEPLRRSLVFVNGFIIAMTEILRAITPKKDKDDTVFNATTKGAIEASEAVDELTGKLAGFDKFNVLQQPNTHTSNNKVAEELNKLLEEQAKIYDEDYQEALKNINNEALNMSKSILSWFVQLDEEGKIVFEDGVPKWTENANLLVDALKLIASIISAKILGGIGKFAKELLTLKGVTAGLSNVLLVGLVYAILEFIQAVKEGDTKTAILAGTFGVLLLTAIILVNKELIKTKAIKIGEFFTSLSAKLNKQTIPSLLNTAKSAKATQKAFLAASAAFAIGGLVALWSSEASAGEKLKHTFLGLAAAIAAGAIALAAFKGNWVKAFSVAATVAGGYFTIASLPKFADGGYTNANLIMTHENGKREWVGKAAGSSAIVNDTQMSDIMEMAVAKGVYSAMTAQNAMGNGNTNEQQTIVVKIGEEAVFNAVRRTANRQGRDFARV